MLLLLMKHHTLDELVEPGVISPRTKYNFLRDLNNLKISANGFGYEFVHKIKIDFDKYLELFKLAWFTVV